MNENRPSGRRKNVTGTGGDVHKRGDGLGTGPVGQGFGSGNGGNNGGDNIRPHSTGSSTNVKRAAGGGSIILIIIMLILGSKGGFGNLLGGLLGGGDTGEPDDGGQTVIATDAPAPTQPVNQQVVKGARDKRTVLKGNGQDTVTIMIYMCGTDLESKHGMASNDLAEMAKANYGDNVRIIVLTGGCSKWKTSGISSDVNQIYRVVNGGLQPLEKNFGRKAMTDPTNLSDFIKYCASNYPASRNFLILWDHGGGSVSGYGYDEKNSRSGSMNLAGINSALKQGGVTFDIIGFDACLMATAETALMLDSYGDYLIASEETEPGIGWYYTNWLTQLGSNTSTPTTTLGKTIIDDFVTTCATKCRGQKTTLSLIDLAEFSYTVPGKLNDFAKSVSGKLQNKDYEEVSNARADTREFAQSTKIDQVDLTNLALNMKTKEGTALANAIKSAVKYNRTSSNMTNAYGVSIYFPYQKTSNVDTAVRTYNQIGMDSEYANCIRQFAALETSGQISAGGSSSPAGSLFDLGSSLIGGSGGGDVLSSLLGSFLGGGRSIQIDGLNDDNIEYMKDQDTEAMAEYVSAHMLTGDLKFVKNASGDYVLSLTEENWALVHSVDKNMFVDDGKGYIDLGLDNVLSYDDKGNLIADIDKTWVAINGHVVAYYHTESSVADGKEYHFGYVPAFVDGVRSEIQIVFDENGIGSIAGVTAVYKDGETETVAKGAETIEAGSKIEFICDYYSYDQKYLDTYYLGDPITATENMTVSDIELKDYKVKIMYRLTDIYDQAYWTRAIDR
ncbi:MAG: peptidase C11 [Lachnospiraceae bacterium]|nr:peptidase C11 [Lachnospiraceae bacterium]